MNQSTNKFVPRVSMAHLNVPNLINSAIVLSSFLHYVRPSEIEFPDDEKDMKEAFLETLTLLRQELSGI